MCNNSHMILTKLLNERLVPLLPDLVSENQSGFVKGRLIYDNSLLSQELAHTMNAKTRGGNLIMKMDMMKAYDRVKWIDLVMRTVQNNFFSVLVNGEICGFFKVVHRLR